MTKNQKTAQELQDRYFPDDCDEVKDTLTGKVWVWIGKDRVRGAVHLVNEDTGEKIIVTSEQYSRFKPVYDE